MNVIPFRQLACPLDGEPLQLEQTSLLCINGHNFDMARTGYTHLLPAQYQRSRNPGDSKLMVSARSRFLGAGHYKPIADAVTQAVLQDIDSSDVIACLDAGCGEGYYLRELAGAGGLQQTIEILGLDISKYAILAAAKKDARPCWIVGSNARLPVLSGSVDNILCIFGFPVYSEFARVLKSKARLIKVDPVEKHLIELRQLIYPVLRPERGSSSGVPEGFAVLSSQRICYPIILTTSGQIDDLLSMTPHRYRASKEGLERVARLSSLTVTVDVKLTIYTLLD